jgi:hypothetical protein
MKPEGLEYFVGKICTIFTVPTNRDFKSENPQTFPQPVFHYFVGRVLEVNQNGICIEQWNNRKKLRTFFFMDHLVSISEEEILDPSNPEDIEVIEEYKKANQPIHKDLGSGEKVKEKIEPAESQYVDIDSLSNLAKENSKINQ